MLVFTYIKDNSSRIQKKNFSKLGNKELWRHLIDELRQNYKIFIDTDSENILNKCNSLENVLAYPRDNKFIEMENDPDNNLSPVLLMVENFLKKYVHDDEEIIILTHITSPFLKKQTIKNAIRKLEEGYEFVHSVTSKQDFAWLDNINNPLNFNPNVIQRTQDLQKIYFSNGAFFIFRKKDFIKYNNRLGKNNFLYELDNIQGIEIDTQADLELAKIIYRGVNSGLN